MKKLTIALFIASIFMFAASVVATTKSFSDVSTSDWFYQDVMNMVEWDVIQGHPDGTFKPQANVNRAELSAMWNRYDNRVKLMQTPNILFNSADYLIIASNTAFINHLSSQMNELNETEYESTCEYISSMKDSGKFQLDQALELVPPEDRKEIESHRTDFLITMDEFQDSCDSVWEEE